MRKTGIAIIVFIFLFTINVTSQNGYFSTEGETGFMKQLEALFNTTGDRKKAKEFIETFEDFWESPNTPAEIKTDIITICDIFYQKKAFPFPDYFEYLQTIMAFQSSGHPQASYQTWHNALLKLFESPRFRIRHAVELCQQTNNALLNNIIYSTPAIQWQSSSSNFQFIFTDSLYLVTDNMALTCRASYDSLQILNTKGRVNLQSGKWQGQKGTITWERYGYSVNEVNSHFNAYKINMKRNEIKIDSVTFVNSHYFKEPLKGHLHHKLVNSRTSNYPKFESYEQFYQIPNIQPNFNYEGGFAQYGGKFLGSGTPQKPARIDIFRNDTLFITARSLYFSLRDDQILSNSAEITLFLDSGTIYHPGIYFKYMADIKELDLIREGEGIAQSPFFNTYHNISMDAELIKWRLNESQIEFRMLAGAEQNHAFFESISYFRESFFHKLQGMDAIHPLQGLLNCSKYWNGRPFTAKDYAQYLGMPENQVRQQVIGLSFHGFIKYNINTDSIEIENRLKDFLLFRAGRKDYDVIQFRSTTPGSIPNAILDLKNYDMQINGVTTVSISDRQNVVFYPEGQKILLKKNRFFQFDGSITSGMIDLFGQGFTFNYDKFRIDLNAIDSMVLHMVVNQHDFMRQRQQQKINNTISNLSGFLEIDRPNNKSGVKEYPEYPRLTSNTNSFVYYDHPSTQSGAYKRDQFFFTLDPFVIDSINYLTRENIAFTGELQSNIFPVMEDTLVVQPDFSLGFTRQSPPEGYPVYDQRALFTNTINLSNAGLKGNGTLNYLTSTSQSKDFTFLPQQTVGNAYSFKVDERDNGVEYPDVNGMNADINYRPYDEKLIATVTSNPFTMYKEEASLVGSLTVSPNGLEGSGQFNMPNAYLTANRYDFSHHIAVADSSDFNLINDAGTTEVNFRTNNLLSTIDFESRRGNFQSHNAGNKVEFTDNLYIAYITAFSWDMDNNDIYLGASGSKGNRFVSTHKRQDSLDFIAPLALYDVENKTIKAQEVKHIDVGDSRMLLSDGNVTIHKEAVLDSLVNVKIVLNDSLHSFYDALVHINGKYNYEASGKYDFINGANAIKTIAFNNITLNKEGETVAEGTIDDKDLFTFNPYFAFKGETRLTAGKPLLDFKGGVQMLHACSMLGPQDYIRFESEIDPQDVRIPLPEKKQNTDLENVYSNFFLNRDSNIIYSAFLEKQLFHSDVPVMSANGVLWFNESRNCFQISDEIKIDNPDTTGNVMRFLNDGCMVTGQGKLNMGLDLGQVKTSASGEIIQSRSDNDTVRLYTLFGLDFMLDQPAIDMMYMDLRNANSTNTGKPESSTTICRMAEWMGHETAVKVAREVQGVDALQSLPQPFQQLFVFDNLDWVWDPSSRSYICDCESTILWMQDKPMNRRVSIKANIVFSRTGNSMNFYIDAGNNIFYFFNYQKEVMNVLSSNEAFNTHIQTVDEKERRMKVGMGEPSYTFVMSPASRMKKFLQIFAPSNDDHSEEEAVEEEDNANEVTQ